LSLPVKNAVVSLLLGLFFLLGSGLVLGGCAQPEGDEELTKNTTVELVDWHITGLMVVNCPVAWLRVTNNNSVPVKDITIQYNTYHEDGAPLDQGTFTIEGTVPPGVTKNFIELYLGIVNVHSEKLSVKLLSVDGE
jgi:LEA14-like dessication related protein